MINKMRLIQQQGTTISSLIQENNRLVDIILGNEHEHGMAEFLSTDIFYNDIEKLKEDYRGRNNENQ